MLEMGDWVIFQIHMENFCGQGGRVLAGFRLGRAAEDQRWDVCGAGCDRVISSSWCLKGRGRKSFLVGKVSRGCQGRKYLRDQAGRQDGGHQAALWGLTSVLLLS